MPHVNKLSPQGVLPRWIFCSLAFLFFNVNSHAQDAHGIQLPPDFTIQSPTLMVTLGDSISAGAFANTAAWLPLSFAPSLFNLGNLPILFNQNLLATTVENKFLWSWASGVGISSHYSRLSDQLRSRSQAIPQMVNLAVSGSVAYDVLLQVQKLAQEMSRHPTTEVLYVTLLIGANDTCDGLDRQKTARDLGQALSVLALIPQKSRMRILVSAIPQVHELGASAIRNHLTGTFGLSCEIIRSHLLKFCNRLTHAANATELNQVIAQEVSMNETLRQVTDAASAHYPQLDLHFTDALFHQDLNFNILAADCFHPNIEGQARISELLWHEQPWFQ